MCRNRKFRLPAQLFLHRFDDVVRHERLSIVLADVSARDVAGFATQITGELAAVVVLYDDRVPCVFQNVKNRLAVERHEPANLELVSRNSLFAEELACRLQLQPRRGTSGYADSIRKCALYRPLSAGTATS